jgi:predicted membrane protein
LALKNHLTMIVNLALFLRFFSNFGYQKFHKTLDFSTFHIWYSFVGYIYIYIYIYINIYIYSQPKKKAGVGKERREERREERERVRRFQVLQQG